MAAALECWSSRASTDEPDPVEQVLVQAQAHHHRSDTSPSSSSSAVVIQRRLYKLGRNVAEAIANIKSSLSLDSVRCDSPISSSSSSRGAVDDLGLAQLYPGTHLPAKLVSSIRKHFNSFPLSAFALFSLLWVGRIWLVFREFKWVGLAQLIDFRRILVGLLCLCSVSLFPFSYAQAEFDIKDVFLHIRLIEQAEIEDQPATLVQELLSDDTAPTAPTSSALNYKLTFACNCSISWQLASEALENAMVRCRKMQLFEKKGVTLGVVLGVVQSGREKLFKIKLENALKSAQRKSKGATAMSKKLPFGLCGCQEETTSRGVEIVGEIEHEIEELNCENKVENSSTNHSNQIKLETTLGGFAYEVSVDEWQTLTIRSGGEEIRKWILNSEEMDFTDQIGVTSFKGVYKGRRILIQKMRGCEKGCAYEFELRRDLLELMTCGHRNILQFYGVCIDENHGLCVVTKMMEGGTVHEIIQKRKKLQVKEVIRIAIDVAEGIKFMNDHGVAYKDLNSQSVWMDRGGNASVGDMGIVSVCRSNGEATEYETDGYRWLAPELQGLNFERNCDPESVKETWTSNVYSFGMVVWEMVTGEAAYSSCSPVQAAVGIAACGLRPEIPKDCPPILRSLMMKCWNSIPSKRPTLSEILSMLTRSNNGSR
ncbi:hypothetical protein Sjap_001495 [Stephania japonica]|uniref:Protein kinase domain-containing protein n=1 Tax=Stephania japonica TaxID=461633 RepID=A0AAP0PTC4_9MAGN